MGIFLVVTVYQANKVKTFNSLDIVVLVATVLIFVLLVAAGGLLSAEAAGDLKIANQAVMTAISLVHNVLPYLAVLSTAVMFYNLIFWGI